jgi:hypothetical protein
LSLTKSQRQLSLNGRKDGHSTSKMLVERTTCRCGIPILDGSNFSDSKVTTLSMFRTTKYLKFKVMLTKKQEMLEFIQGTMEDTKDGMLSILTRKVKILEKVNLTEILDSMLIDHSILDLKCQ